MSENEIFEIPVDDTDNEVKVKKPRKKRELSEDQKEVLRERLKKAREARKLKAGSKKEIKKIKKEIPSEVETIIESDSDNNHNEVINNCNAINTTVELTEDITEIDLNDVATTDKEIMNLQLDINEMNEKLNKKKKKTANTRKGVIIRQRQNIDHIVEMKVNEKLAKLNSVVQGEMKRRTAPPKKVEHTIKAPVVALKTEPPKPKLKPVSIGLNTPFWAL